MAISRKISTKGFIKQTTTQDLALGNLINAANATVIDRFSGDGVTTTFTLSASPTVTNTMVFISGVYQEKNTYLISGDQIIFSAAPPSGTQNIEVLSGTSLGSVGSSESGGTKNYLTTYNGNPGNGDFEDGTTSGWSLFNTTLTSLVPTGSISSGAATFTTFQASSSSPLAATSSLSTAGTYSAGQGFISDTFTIDSEDQSKVMAFKFYYKVNSGASNGNFSGTSSNTFAVYIYDVTNAAWIQPAGVYNLVQNSGAGLALGTFQTTSNSTQYRIAVICINNASGSIAMQWDDFFVGPQITGNAPAVSDWTSYTPTFTGFGTVTNIDMYWKRVGDTIKIQGKWTNGTVSGATASFTLPNGQVSTNFASVRLVGYVQEGNITSTWKGVLSSPNSNILTFGAQNSSNAGLSSKTGSSVFGNSDVVSIFCEVPIAGLSSNSVMSNDTDTRVVSAIINGGPQTSYTANTPIIFPSAIKDTHAAYNASTGQYTAPVSGFYQVSAFVNTNAANSIMSAYVGGAQKAPSMGAILSSVGFGGGSTVVYANAGQTIDVRLSVSWTSISSGNGLTIQRVSGPAVIAASESINARYTSTNGQACNSNPFKYEVKTFDSHNAYDTSTGIYTAPISGKYRVSATIRCAAGVASWDIGLDIYKGSTIYASTYRASADGAGTTGSYSMSATTLVNLLAGETIKIVGVGFAGQAASTTSGYNEFCIERVGN